MSGFIRTAQSSSKGGKRKYAAPYQGTAKRFKPTPNYQSMAFVSAQQLRNAGARGMRLEKKVVDIAPTQYSPETTGTQLQLLNGCIAGSQNYNRIGRKIHMKSLQIHGEIHNTDASSGPVVVRLLIVYDKQSNGAAPTLAMIITSQTIAGATSSSVFDMVNLDNRDRFEIIRDKYYPLGVIDNTATQTYANGPGNCVVNEFIPLGGRETTYNAGTAGTVGDIQSGALYMFLVSNQTAAAGATSVLGFRTRFIDV